MITTQITSHYVWNQMITTQITSHYVWNQMITIMMHTFIVD